MRCRVFPQRVDYNYAKQILVAKPAIAVVRRVDSIALMAEVGVEDSIVGDYLIPAPYVPSPYLSLPPFVRQDAAIGIPPLLPLPPQLSPSFCMLHFHVRLWRAGFMR